mgnify:CR=1 FL=1
MSKDNERLTIWIKQDVRGVPGSELWKVMKAIFTCYLENGFVNFYITSINDGHHISGSLHYVNNAIDFQTLGLPIEKLQTAIDSFCKRYYLDRRCFELFYSGTHKKIFHLEYDVIRLR